MEKYRRKPGGNKLPLEKKYKKSPLQKRVALILAALAIGLPPIGKAIGKGVGTGIGTGIITRAQADEIVEGLKLIEQMPDFKTWYEVEKYLENVFKGKNYNEDIKKDNEIKDLIKDSIKSAWNNYSEYEMHEENLLSRVNLIKYYITCVEQTDEIILVDLNEKSDDRRQLNREGAAGDNTTSYDDNKNHRIRLFRYDDKDYMHEIMLHELIHSSLNNFMMYEKLETLNIDKNLKKELIENKEIIRSMFAESAASLLSRYVYSYEEYMERINNSTERNGIGYNEEDAIIETHGIVYPTYSYCANKLIFFGGIDNLSDFLLGKKSFEDFCNKIIEENGRKNFEIIMKDIIEILKAKDKYERLNEKSDANGKEKTNDSNKLVKEIRDIELENEYKELHIEDVNDWLNIVKSYDSFKKYIEKIIASYNSDKEMLIKKFEEEYGEFSEKALQKFPEESYLDDYNYYVEKIKYYDKLTLEAYCQESYKSLTGQEVDESSAIKVYKEYLNAEIETYGNLISENLTRKKTLEEQLKIYDEIRYTSKYYKELEKIALEKMKRKIENVKTNNEVVKLLQEYNNYRKISMCNFLNYQDDNKTEEYLKDPIEALEDSLMEKLRGLHVQVGTYQFGKINNEKLDNVVFESILQIRNEALIDSLQVSDVMEYNYEESKKYALSKISDKEIRLKCKRYLEKTEDGIDVKEGTIRVITFKDSNGKVTHCRFVKNDQELEKFYGCDLSIRMKCFEYLENMKIESKEDFLSFLNMSKELPDVLITSDFENSEEYSIKNEENMNDYNISRYILQKIFDEKIEIFERENLSLTWSDLNPRCSDKGIPNIILGEAVKRYKNDVDMVSYENEVKNATAITHEIAGNLSGTSKEYLGNNGQRSTPML